MKKKLKITAPERPTEQARPICARATGTKFDAFAAGDEEIIQIYAEIGEFGINAADFKSKLDAVSKPNIRLMINSPGGDVFDGIAMYNDLVAHPASITVEITGIAASAASIIAMAGDTIEMHQNTFLMIHNAWSVGIGNRHEIMKLVAVLEKIDGSLAETYAAATGKPVKEIAELMDAETWMTAAEAVEAGFATALIEDDAEVSARFDLAGFKNAPAALHFDDGSRPEFKTRKDIEDFLHQHCGLSRSVSRGLVAAARGQNDEIDLEKLESVARFFNESAAASAAALTQAEKDIKNGL